VDAITSYRLGILGVDPAALADEPLPERLSAAYAAFIREVPFENLSHQRSCRGAPETPRAWPRATDRMLREHRVGGTGGTCFSLAYALRDLLQGVGGNAHLILGRNLVTEEMHAAVVVFDGPSALLFDPTLLSPSPLPMRTGSTVEDPLGTIRLVGTCREALTVMIHKPRDRRAHAAYAIGKRPAHPRSFRRAWIGSFDRGRRRPLRLARRVGDVIHRYSECPSRLERLTPGGAERRDLDEAPVRDLHELFGIREDYLSEWFART
jgi:arylamine N-acetyltransferase